MKVIQIYKDFYPPVVGGIEGHINLLSKGLKEKGIEVHVLVSNKKPKLENKTIDGIKVIKAPEFGRWASAPLNFTFPQILRKMALKSDLLHFHLPNPTAEISYLLCGIDKPVIATYHSDIIRQARLKHMYSPFQRIFLDKTDGIIATSPRYVETSDVLNNYKYKCHIIPLGINLNRFKYDDPERISRIKNQYGDRILLFVGRFRYYKGLHVLIDAMQYVENTTLLIIGDGELKPELIKRARRKNLKSKIHFLGELSDDEVNLYLKTCNIFVLPSILRSEAFGIVILEALSCGCPVISTELGTGTSYTNIGGHTGLVVPPYNSFKLAEAINYLLTNRNKMREFGLNGRNRVQKLFCAEKMISDTIELYNSTIKDHGTTIAHTTEHANSNVIRKRKIKVIRVVSRMNIGGPAIHVSLLSKQLDARRFDSKLVTGSVSSREGDMSYLIQNKNGMIKRIHELQREIHPIKDFIALFKIFRLINKEKPDIVHSHMAKAGTTARLAVGLYNLLHRKRIRIVHTFHGHVLDGYFSKTKSKIFKIIERMIASFTDGIIAISRTQKWELTKKYRIADTQKVYIINLGLNLSPFVNCDALKGTFRQKIGIDNKTILIGIVGRLVPIKNHFMFLDAAKDFLNRNFYNPVKFVIIGDGELKTELEQYADRLNIRDKIIFHGWEKNIPIVYSDLDILALTSMNEGTPVSLIEAMAAGVPVITTGVGGVKDLLGRYEDATIRPDGFFVCERGIVLKKNDSVGLANGFQFIIKNRDSDRIQRSRDFVLQNYSDKKLVDRIEKLYESLVFMPKDEVLLNCKQ